MVMESIPMSNPVDVVPPPNLLTYGVAHILIGVLVGALTRMVFKQKVKVAIVAGIIAVGLHYNFDAPLARKLSALEDLVFSKRNTQLQKPLPN